MTNKKKINSAETSQSSRRLAEPCKEKQKRVGHYIGITPPNPLADEIMTKLENENIYLSRRGPGLRIAPHLFNDRRDIERLFAVLD